MSERYEKDDILASKWNGNWIKFSISDYCKYSEIMSYGFYELGLRKGDRVVTIMNNRSEFNIIDMALSMLGIIHIPVYPTLSKNDYTYIINHSDAKVLIIGNLSIYRKLQPLFGTFTGQPKIYTLDRVENEEVLFSVFKMGISNRKKDAPLVQEIKNSILPSDIATQVYTSGTTGTPKGVLLTHDNLVSNFKAHAMVEPMDHHCKVLSFLPLCHVFERTMNYHYQYLGISIYYVDNMGLIMQTSKDIKADGFCAVPRVMEVMHDKILSAGKDLDGRIARTIYRLALRHGYKYAPDKGSWYRFWQHFYDSFVYHKIRKSFGGKEMTIISGGSALNAKICRLFHAIGLRIFEGYGMTETGPVIAVNNPVDNLYRIGTVGPALPNVQLKFGEDQEILVKGPSIMKGYYKDSNEDIQRWFDEDGWFHTGDIGKLIDGRYLQITDRKKEIFKLSAGKYIAPQAIENRLKESELIENVMVVGENEKYAAALISPNYNFLHFWANKHKVHYRDNAELIRTPEILERFQQEIVMMNKDLAPHEQIKGFRLVTEEWGPQTGELSPTLKLKRNILMQKYEALIAQMYNPTKEKEQYFSFKQINLNLLDTIRHLTPEKILSGLSGKQGKDEDSKETSK